MGAEEYLREEDLLRAIQRGGGVDVHVWQTTALALVDGQTKALTLAARVAVTPEELPLGGRRDAERAGRHGSPAS